MKLLETVGMHVSHETKHGNPQVISCGNGKNMQDFSISHYAV